MKTTHLTIHRVTSSLLNGTPSSAFALVVNLVLAYLCYFIARLEFLLENWSLLSEDLSFSHLSTLFGGGIVFDTTAIVYTNMLYIVLMLVPLAQKENPVYHKVCKWLFVIVNSLALLINLADSVYFPYTLRRTTTTVFSEFGHENNLGGIVGTELLHHWYLVLLFALLVFLLWRLYFVPKASARDYRTLRQRLRYALAYVVCLLLAVPLCVGGARGGLGTGIRPITINNANQYVDRPVECGLVLNTPFSLIRTIGKSVFEVPSYYPDEQQLAAVFTPIHRPDTTFQAANKRNVVIIIIESFGREYISALNKGFRPDYEGYTPEMDKIVNQSLVFAHSYANGHKSIDGMPSVLCGIPMFVEPFVLTPASMNTYTSLAGLLDKEGYHTAFFHGANRGSMGFLAFANKVGFQQYYGRQDYDQDKRFGGDSDFDGNWGIWDEPFLQYYATKLSEMKEPFMTALFTVSSHHPFEVPKEYEGKFPKGHLPIHQCIGYTDKALGEFFRTASRQPWFKHTLFVITADHTNQSYYDEYKSDIGTFEVPVIFFDPSGRLKPGMSPSIAQQIDIMPTVLSYLGYRKPYLSFGCDLLTTPPDQTYALNYINGTYQYTKYGYVMQFSDGKVKALYALSDRLMRHNLIGRVPCQGQMERELKAIIQQYMTRMVNDKLLP